MEKALDKLNQRCKHRDKVFEQYNINNYQYIDKCGILHESLTQFINNRGQVHKSPLQFMAEYGTVYDDLDYKSKLVEAKKCRTLQLLPFQLLDLSETLSMKLKTITKTH
jgi:hypothetical protein